MNVRCELLYFLSFFIIAIPVAFSNICDNVNTFIKFEQNGVLLLKNENLCNLKGLQDHPNTFERVTIQKSSLKSMNGVSSQENLRLLDLSGNLLNTTTGLENLQFLSTVVLSKNIIEVVKGIGSNVLKTLDLSFNREFNMDSLKSVSTTIEKLILKGCDIGEISGLSHFGHLEKLVLSHNDLFRVKGLKNLKNLKIVDLSNNKLNSIGDLHQLAMLEEILLKKNRFESLREFVALLEQNPTLSRVVLAGNPLEESKENCLIFHNLRSSERAESLILEDSFVKWAQNCDDGSSGIISVREKNPNLLSFHLERYLNSGQFDVDQRITISDARIRKMTNINDFPSLLDARSFVLKGNKVETIRGISALNKLSRLEISGCRIKEIGKGLLNLKETLIDVDVSNNQLVTLDGLEGLRKLERLKLDGNMIEEVGVAPELNFPHMVHLSLKNNSIRMVENVGAFPDLKKLELSGNDVEKIENLGLLNNLKYLSLDSNNIKDLQFLEELQSVEKLDLRDNPIEVTSENLKILFNLQANMEVRVDIEKLEIPATSCKSWMLCVFVVICILENVLLAIFFFINQDIAKSIIESYFGCFMKEREDAGEEEKEKNEEKLSKKGEVLHKTLENHEDPQENEEGEIIKQEPLSNEVLEPSKNHEDRQENGKGENMKKEYVSKEVLEPSGCSRQAETPKIRPNSRKVEVCEKKTGNAIGIPTVPKDEKDENDEANAAKCPSND